MKPPAKRRSDTLLREELSEALLAANPIATAILNERGITGCNRLFEQAFGRGPGELIGLALRELYANDADYERIGTTLYDALAAGGAHEFELELKRRSGERFWGLLRAGLLERDKPGGAAVFTLLDITDRRAREATQRFVDDGMPGVLAYVDCDERLRYLSGTAEGLYGTRLSDIGKTLREISKPEAYAAAEAHIHRALAGETVTYRRSHTRPDGGVLEIHARLTPDRGPDGVVRGYVGLFTDVTELTAVQRAQADSQLRLERQQAALSRLTIGGFLQSGTADRFLREVTEAGAAVLGVERVSLWQMDAGRSAIFCRDLYERTPDRHAGGAILAAKDCPSYFDALAERQIVDIADANADPRTAEFSAGYLRPLGIGAMLDAPLMRGRDLLGVLCCEHVGGQRAWTADEKLFASALANLAALAIESGERKHAEAELENLNRELEQRVAARTSELQASEKRYRTLVEWSPAPISVHRGGKLIYVNAAAVGMFGATSAQDLLGRTVLDLVHPDSREIVVGRMKELAAGAPGAPLAEVRFLRLDGGTADVQIHTASIVFDGEPAYNVLGHDITERKRAEAALRDREAQLRIVAENIPAIVVRYDQNFVCRYANSQYGKLVGRDPEQLIGLRFEEIVGSKHAAQEYERGCRVLAGERVRFERRRHDGDGTLDITLVPYVAPDGTQDGYFAFGVDITDRRRHEDTLRESEARLRSVIDVLPTLIYCKDGDDRYLLCNRANAATFGKTPDEMLGRSQTEKIATREAASIREAERLARTTGEIQVAADFRMTGPDGRERVFHCTRIPFRYSDEHPDAVLGVITEITELMAAQAELERLNRGLEGHIAERTAELARANKELEAFSYSISHDLRSPVRAMAGFAAILVAEHGAKLPPDARKLIQRVADAGMRMGIMIDGLLLLSRLSRDTLTRRSVDLAALAREIWSEVTVEEPQRQVAFHAPDRCLADCDPVLTRNVLQNLLGNAFKYTRRTAVARVEFGSIEGDERVFFVRDNGVGFDMAYAGKLFGTFQRLHTDREFEGTGVGLAIARRIVERHGGRIWAEACTGEGASFQFTLGAGSRQ